MVKDLKAFLMRGNVVDLAVAVVIGGAFALVIASFVENIINPIIAAIFGEPDISQVLAITLRESDQGDAVLRIGAFFQSILNFVIIGTALFVVVQAYNKMQDMRGGVPDEDAAPPSDEVILLTEIRDSLRARG